MKRKMSMAAEDILLQNTRPGTRLAYRFFKRTFDAAVSSIGLILLSPVFLVVAIAIKLEDPKGKIFYIAPRGGLHNQPFHFYKSVSMRNGQTARLLETTFCEICPGVLRGHSLRNILGKRYGLPRRFRSYAEPKGR
jgi:lipopolysaccharide/colanic/teichoic acid biosynthesis glycosyltransferase